MALPFFVDDIATVPEAFRGEYTEKDGKHHLSVTGLETTYVPRAALTAANSEAATRRHALNSWETAAAGKSVEEIQTIIADFDGGKFNKGKSAEEFNAALTAHKTESDRKIAGIVGERDTAYGVARKAVVDGGLATALATAKATKTGMAMLPKILGERVDLKFENGASVMKILNTDGKTPMIGTGADGFATFDDLMKEAVGIYPDLFEGTGGGGGGAPPKGGGGGAGEKTISRAEFDKLSPPDQGTKIRSGFSVVDA